jgi:hypothetical protein
MKRRGALYLGIAAPGAAAILATSCLLHSTDLLEGDGADVR